MSLVGVVQGRLSKSPKNRLQFFPKKNWKNEFNKAKKIGFDFIEFFSERKFNENNPIWDIKKIEEYIKLSKENNLKILNFCDDYIISHSINKKTTQKYIKKLIKNLKDYTFICGKKVNIKLLTVAANPINVTKIIIT